MSCTLLLGSCSYNRAHFVDWMSVISNSLADTALFKEGIYDNDVEKAYINPSPHEGGVGGPRGWSICSCYWSKLGGHAWRVTATYLHDIDGWASSWPPTYLRNGPCCSSFTLYSVRDCVLTATGCRLDMIWDMIRYHIIIWSSLLELLHIRFQHNGLQCV